jgi:hypothetical protein
MDIFYGKRERKIGSSEMTGPSCEYCGNSLYRVICIIRYFHIYWIPIFSTGIICASACHHCGKASRGKDLPCDFTREIRQRTFRPAKLIPYFAGAIVMLGVMVFVIVTDHYDQKKTETFIASPQVGDFYVISPGELPQKPDYPFSVMMVTAVEDDTVLLQVGNARYKNATGASNAIIDGEADKDGYYSDFTLSSTLDELKSFRERGQIDSVRRQD